MQSWQGGYILASTVTGLSVWLSAFQASPTLSVASEQNSNLAREGAMLGQGFQFSCDTADTSVCSLPGGGYN